MVVTRSGSRIQESSQRKVRWVPGSPGLLASRQSSSGGAEEREEEPSRERVVLHPAGSELVWARGFF